MNKEFVTVLPEILWIKDEKLREAEVESMKEGYLAMAKENVREAEEALTLTREVILRNG